MSRTHLHGGIAFSSFGGQGAVFAFTNTTAAASDQVTTVKVETKEKAGNVVAWGPENDYPQKVIAKVKDNASATAALGLRIDAHYGEGVVFLKKEVTEDGKHDYKVVPIDTLPEIKEFWKTSRMKMFWKETITDLEWWQLAFPEYILSNNFATINRVKRQKTAWTRYEVMNETSGLVENVYISEKFGKEGVNADSAFVSIVPLIDPYWTVDEVREYCKKNNIKKFIRPVFFPMVDEAYYPTGGWHAIIRSGWIDIANAVPKWVMNMFKNQVSIKYHIEIDERYYEKAFSNWKQLSDKEKNAERIKTIEAITEHLSKPENAGKSIQTMMFEDGDGKQISAVKITTIDDKFKDGAFLPQSEVANSEELFAFRVDPSLIGAGIPGAKLGAGSGSDKRIAFFIHNALSKTKRETTLEVFEFIRDFNGWDDTITAQFENTNLTTLDKNPTGSEKTT